MMEYGRGSRLLSSVGRVHGTGTVQGIGTGQGVGTGTPSLLRCTGTDKCVCVPTDVRGLSQPEVELALNLISQDA